MFSLTHRTGHLGSVDEIKVYIWEKPVWNMHRHTPSYCPRLFVGVRGVWPDGVHSWLHLHHAWRLDPR